MAQCFSCGTEIDRAFSLSRASTCLECGADLKVCWNCRHFDPAAAHQCRESIDRVVQDKDRGNYCDFFQLPLPGEKVRGMQPGCNRGHKPQVRQAFEDLFGAGD